MSKGQSTKRSRQIIRSFEAKSLRKRSFTTRLADSLTKFFGSIGFLLLNLAFFTIWIIVNSGNLLGGTTFDPYPYVLLITFVSLEAIVLTVIVLMSQNRQSQTDTLREELQLQVELIAEKEISKVLKLLNELLKHEGIEVKDPELAEMLEAIDASYIERKLEKQLAGKEGSIKKTVEEVGKSLQKK